MSILFVILFIGRYLWFHFAKSFNLNLLDRFTIISNYFRLLLILFIYHLLVVEFVVLKWRFSSFNFGGWRNISHGLFGRLRHSPYLLNLLIPRIDIKLFEQLNILGDGPGIHLDIFLSHNFNRQPLPEMRICEFVII